MSPAKVFLAGLATTFVFAPLKNNLAFSTSLSYDLSLILFASCGKSLTFLVLVLWISLAVLRIWVLMSDYLGLILAVPLPAVSSWEHPSAFLSLSFLILGMRMRAAPASQTCFVDWITEEIKLLASLVAQMVESAYSAGDPGLIPGLGRSSDEGNGYPLQYSCLEHPMDKGAWWATVCGVAKNWTRLSN